jgi:hypothetical protein
MRYPTIVDGEWIQPIRKGFYAKCCDCGLVHKINFRTVKGKIQFQAFRIKKRRTRV